MKIRKESYRGIEYVIHFTDSVEWYENRHKFYIESDHNLDNGYYKDLDDLIVNVQATIDKELGSPISTVDELVDKLSELIVWTGYEDCHFDTKMAKIYINNFLSSHDSQC